jgi:hypothetical protein
MRTMASISHMSLSVTIRRRPLEIPGADSNAKRVSDRYSSLTDSRSLEEIVLNRFNPSSAFNIGARSKLRS